MDEKQIADALTSGMLGPTIGGAVIVLAWVASKLRGGVPFVEQFKAAWPTMKGGLLAGAMVGGGALVAQRPWMESLAAGLVVFLALGNLRAQPPAPPAVPPAAEPPTK